MMSSILLYLGQFLLFACTLRASSPTCDYIEPNKDLWTRENIEEAFNNTFDKSYCESNYICNKTFSIISIKTFPYYNSTWPYVRDMLYKCCGYCNSRSFPNSSKVIANTSELTRESISTADMVFPVLAREDTEILYGFHFVPFIPAPSTFYITRREDNFLKNILSIWPVVIVCLLMSIIAGFLCWIFETWKNEEEFPKPFHLGLFEGVWWSFT